MADKRILIGSDILHFNLDNGYTISVGVGEYHYCNADTVEVAVWYNEPSGGQPWVLLQEHDSVAGWVTPDELVRLMALVQRIGTEPGRITAIDPKLWRENASA